MFVEAVIPEEEASETKPSGSSEGKTLDLDQINLISTEDKEESEKSSSNRLSSNPNTQTSPVKTNFPENGKESTDEDPVDDVIVEKPSLNGDKVEKTRKNGVYGHQTLVPEDIKEATKNDTTKIETDSHRKEHQQLHGLETAV